MLAAKEKTLSGGEVLPQAKTRVRGLPLENANGTEVLRPASSTLVWGWSPLYAGTASEQLDQRYYGADKGRFWSPDPGGAGTDSTDPTSWNRYSYVRGDPVNRGDPSGLCDVLLAGITMNPVSGSGFAGFGSGMITAYPYSGTNVATGAGSVAGQSGGPNPATQLAYQAIMAAAQDSGPINIFAFSGGAQAFAAALLLLPSDVASRINNITYLPPGSFGGQLPSASSSTTSGNGTTTVIWGGGIIDTIVVGNLPYGARSVRTRCGHDANCEIKENLKRLQSLSGSTCSNPQVLTLGNLAAPASGGGGGGGDVADAAGGGGYYFDIGAYLDYLWLSGYYSQPLKEDVSSTISYIL